MDLLAEEIGISRQQIHETTRKDRFQVLVHNSWLKSLAKNGKLTKFKNHESLEEDWWSDTNYKSKNWTKTYFCSLKKYNFKVFPLPRNRDARGSDISLTYPQLLHYVNQSNHKNLWKAAFRKYRECYVNQSGSGTGSGSKPVSVVTYDELLREIIKRMYNCRIVHYKLDYIYVPLPDCREANAMETKSGIEHLYPAICAIETSSHYYLIYDSCLEYTLADCVTHSPAILKDSYNKNLFLIYQLFNLMKNLHELGLLLGDINLHDIYLKENLFLQVIPNIKSNIFQYKTEDEDRFLLRKAETVPKINKLSYSLKDYCRMWCCSQISNFEYLTVLNNAVGRSIDLPDYHHIMPWVTDFEHRNGQNWRDFNKSKFRLNKGDPQLDLTYSPNSNNTTPHHVSDVLSEITYYVYKARRTSKKLLCKHVRPIWVPAEYPVSIQRLQAWTPDECIPEFYNDPTIFKSIHEDLADLEVPKWATCPEDFIQKHREALESQYVSERLHHWIDLTYGYKLSGQPAIKSKNVCLSMVDNHTNLCRRGIVQLFSYPHPGKISNNPWMDKSPPRISVKIERGRSSENLYNFDVERQEANNIERSSSFYTKTPTKCIKLPADYNPISQLIALEDMNIFLNKTFPSNSNPPSISEPSKGEDQASVDTSGFTNKLFEDKLKDSFIVSNVTNFKQIVSEYRARELQVVGCVLVEVFLSNKIRPFNDSSDEITFEKRLQNCIELTKKEYLNLPKCVEYPLKVLLQFDDKEAITDKGLPQPSAHQILQPLLNNSLFPFPIEYVQVSSILSTIHKFNRLLKFLDLYSFDGSSRTENTRISVQRKMARCKINICVTQMEDLLKPKAFEQFDPLEIILPFFVELISSEDTSIMAAWHLFDVVAAALGMTKTKQYLLIPILNLYEIKPGKRISKSSKSFKLYHHWFLIRLIVRFGLTVFLENFITPLVEAVGGIKEEIEDLPPVQNEDQTKKLPDANPSTSQNVSKTQDDIFNMDMPEEVSQQLPNEDLPKSVITRKKSSKSKNPSKSEVSAGSLIWLSHRLGPVLTARFVTRKLLKMLTLCYVGGENLVPEEDSEELNQKLSNFSVTNSRVIGDKNAIKVLDCLTSIAVLFGEQFILIQYFPHVSELIGLCKKKIVSSLEGALISGLELIKHLVPYLNDTILMDQLQGIFLQNFIHPIIRILASSQMPSGYLSRNVLSRKLIDTIYILSIRIGREMTKEHLCVPALERFFSIFDKTQDETVSITSGNSDDSDVEKFQILDEIHSVFTPELAHCCYLPFLSYLGEAVMQSCLKNFPMILVLCQEYEQPTNTASSGASSQKQNILSKDELTTNPMETSMEYSNSFGSQVIGNRIEVRKEPSTEPTVNEILGMVTYKVDRINTSRHLKGNWLAYWEHENGRNDKNENHFDIKQIKLQTFSGHTNAVKNILALDNENSFMSASKDKTVKLWSLRSEGDGSKVTSCQYTYGLHKKSVHCLGFLESLRLAVSCDSAVHVWDPFVGSVVGQLEKSAVSVIKTCTTPSSLIMAGTVESTVRTIDVRTMNYVNEWKLTQLANGPVRCMALSPNGNWLTVGLSSGQLYNLDTRMGLILSSWKPTEGELLQVVAPNEEQLITSSLDHSVSVWNVNDGSFQFNLQGISEPSHCLCLNGSELIVGTPANKIGVHTAVAPDAAYSVTKLRSDTVKGVLTSMAILPLNRLLLLAGDSGHISLVC